MAPDASGAAAGRKLAQASQWQGLGCSDRAAWGECRGSALYQIRVSLLDRSTKCSCPSRKFPCKHALGLLFLIADSPPVFTRDPEPEWVTSWLDKKDAAAQKKQARAAEPDKPADAVAQAKRANKRHQAVLDGLEHLDTWLADLVRTGLGRLATEGAVPFEMQARRLVDAQAPGLATRVRAVGESVGRGGDWAERVLGELGKLALLSHAYRRLEALPPLLAEDVRRRIGFTLDQSEVIARGDVVDDQWTVVASVTEDDDRVRSQRVWLIGARSQRRALVLQYAAGQASFAEVLVVGTVFEARLAFWPGAAPERALLVTRLGEPRPLDVGSDTGYPQQMYTIAQTLSDHAKSLAQDPWLERQLCLLGDVQLAPGEPWLLVDQDGAALPLAGAQHDVLLALSGGGPLGVVAEWDGFNLAPLTAFSEGRVITLFNEIRQ